MRLLSPDAWTAHATTWLVFAVQLAVGTETSFHAKAGRFKTAFGRGANSAHLTTHFSKVDPNWRWIGHNAPFADAGKVFGTAYRITAETFSPAVDRCSHLAANGRIHAREESYMYSLADEKREAWLPEKKQPCGPSGQLERE
jgi:hypothetical protein